MISLTETFIELFPKYINPEFNYWIHVSTLKTIELKDISKRLNQISKIRNKCNREKVLDEYLDTLISELIDNSGCNAIVFNIPEIHQEESIVTEQTIHDTFVWYGPIFAVHKYNDIAYIWFFYNTDAKSMCETIDNMQCEENILQCQFMEANLIMNNYCWATKITYKTFNIKDIKLRLSDIDSYWKSIV